MKTVLLALLANVAHGFDSVDTGIEDICKPGAIHIVERPIFVHTLDYQSYNFDTIEKVAKCNKTSKAQILRGFQVHRGYEDASLLNPSIYPEARSHTLDYFDGLDFDITELRTDADIEAFLKGYTSKGVLSLTMRGDQWPLFSQILNEKKNFFMYFCFIVKDKLAYTKLDANDTFKNTPKTPVYLLFDKEQSMLDKSIDWVKHGWIKGFAYKRTVERRSIIITKKPENRVLNHHYLGGCNK
ncbi:hypothetical protein DSO57_1021815 [Entomophthora muscae]|uniref:Uncharacterized protein n=1 Tax=Entomophthora muscae TaxID=34485 RepID=A0ACC2TEP4_9FUNG|nr:hypothetical protein DSO57_1021815 [Entomophthora muscae]